MNLSPEAKFILEKRYLLRNSRGKVIETPEEMFWRVAKEIAKAERIYGKRNVEETEREFFEMMKNLEFLPNSPTLMNAGTRFAQLSACFVLPLHDSIQSIFTTLKEMALIHKTGGGTGFSFSEIRPKGDLVKGTHGIASGPVSFIRIFDTATDIIKQGGKRRGANMGVLRVSHPDIIGFIQAKSIYSLSNFNLSVGITDDFMEAVENGEKYTLINPRTHKTQKILSATKIMDEIVRNAWERGDPGMLFLDEINRKHPLKALGRIEATNPCITSDVWIMTSEGPQQVKELIGKQFEVIVNGKKWKTDKNGFFKTGRKKVFKIITKEGFEFEATLNHPVLKVKRKTRYVIETEWVKISELKKGDEIIINNHRNLEGWKGRYGEKEGYLMGLLIGEGTVRRDKVVLSLWGNSKGARSIRKKVLEYVRSFSHRSDFRGWIKVKNTSEYRLSAGYVKKLSQELGMYPKKRITEKIERTSSDFYKGFLRGFFDADGCIIGNQKKGISIRLAQSNLELLKVVQRMLLRLGISSKIYKNRRKEDKCLLPNGRGGKREYSIKPQHELVISNDNIFIFLKRIGFGDKDKMKKLKTLVKKYKRKPNRERFIVKIESVSFKGMEDVYDVSVPGINALDANGFIVHNCGEQPLLPYESCNLGSINLSKFVENQKIQWKALGKTIQLAVRFLDNVIDVNQYPLKKIRDMTLSNRKIGLGIMGFAEMLIRMRIPYYSKKALLLGERIMEFLQKESRQASKKLANERGEFPNWNESEIQWKQRNATLTTIAPTGTISLIAGTTSGIEPIFGVVYTRTIIGKEFLQVSPGFQELAKEMGFWSMSLLKKIHSLGGSVQKIPEIPKEAKELLLTSMEIPGEHHVRMQAVFQKYTDNAVSKTVNLPADTNQQRVKEIFELAYKLKCKGITVYRYGSKESQVLKCESCKV